MRLRAYFLHVLVAAALLSAQYGELRHALSHAVHDVEVAAHGADGAPPLDHSLYQCVSYKAVGAALNGPLPTLACNVAVAELPPVEEVAFDVQARVVFDTRAPPQQA